MRTVVLILAAALQLPPSSVPIVDRSRQIDATEIGSLNRWFSEPPRPCRAAARGGTLSARLGPNLTGVIVGQFTKQWSSMAVVRDYLVRILVATPEDVAPIPPWSNPVSTEIIASATFRTGPPTPLQFGNGYVHFEDQAGCEWFARYLGPDPSKWVVRR